MEDIFNQQLNFFNFIEKEIDNNRISHAYLIETNNYAGTDMLIKEFLKYLLCKDKRTNRSCNCKICNLIDNNSYPDIENIYADGNYIKKEQLIKVQDNFRNKSNYDNKQIYIIWDAERLNSSSANTMLKFLEEPEDGIVAILVATNRYKVIETIVSRCQVLSLNATADNKLSDNEQSICDILFSFNNLFCNYDNLLSLIPDRVIAKDCLKSIENAVFDWVNAKKNSYGLSLNQLINIIDILEKTLNKLEYNVNYKLAIDNLLTDMMEVKNEKVGKLC